MYDHTALHSAVWEGHDNVVKTLLENGADVNLKNKDANTALAIAIKEAAKVFTEKKTEKKEEFQKCVDYLNNARLNYLCKQGAKKGALVGSGVAGVLVAVGAIAAIALAPKVLEAFKGNLTISIVSLISATIFVVALGAGVAAKLEEVKATKLGRQETQVS